MIVTTIENRTFKNLKLTPILQLCDIVYEIDT